MAEKAKEVIRQTGKPAAALVGIITILLISYIIFLPAETREELLGDKNLTEISKDKEETEENQLLLTQIGTLSYLEEERVDHYIPGAYLEEKKEAKILAEYDVFTVSRGLLGGEGKKKIFSIKNLEKISKAVLTFQAPIRSGTLKITINDHTVFEDEVSTSLPRPIELPHEYLERNNELIFEVPGGFLDKGEYKLEDVKIIGTTIDEEKMSAEHRFTIPETEIENFRNAYLEFRITCTQKNVGSMEIELNNRLLSTTTPACNNLNRIEVFSEDLNIGRNEIKFMLQEGTARLGAGKIRVNLKEQKGFTDFFVIEEKQWKKIEDEKKKVILDIEFVDDFEKKRAEVSVNGRRDIINQKVPHYTKDITRYVKSGNNYIQILPLTELTIVELEVRVEDS